MKTIKFRDADTGMCEINLNLLAHAQTIELDIGSECGGFGICGKDRVRIPADQKKQFSKPTEAESKHLSPQELNEGWRLACQCFPNVETDITIEFKMKS